MKIGFAMRESMVGFYQKIKDVLFEYRQETTSGNKKREARVADPLLIVKAEIQLNFMPPGKGKGDPRGKYHSSSVEP
jgi:hypothetical protein